MCLVPWDIPMEIQVNMAYDWLKCDLISHTITFWWNKVIVSNFSPCRLYMGNFFVCIHWHVVHHYQHSKCNLGSVLCGWKRNLFGQVSNRSAVCGIRTNEYRHVNLHHQPSICTIIFGNGEMVLLLTAFSSYCRVLLPQELCVWVPLSTLLLVLKECFSL